MVRQRFLIPFIEVRILAGHPVFLCTAQPGRDAWPIQYTHEARVIVMQGIGGLAFALEV